MLRRVDVAWLAVAVLACAFSSPAQQPVPAAENQSLAASPSSISPQSQPPDPQTLGSISGTVVDSTGLPIPGAKVSLTRTRPTFAQEVATGLDGSFSFANLPASDYTIVVAASGFNAQSA